jgi:D-alanyl-D-alanine carboxypeptidase
MGAEPPPRRTPRIVAVAAAYAVALGLGAPPAGAAPPAQNRAAAVALVRASEPIGGPLLAGRGVIARLRTGAPALPKHITAKGWLVADLDSGAVLAARNPHGRFLPASTLKTLTAVTLIPRLDPDKLVRPSFDAVNIEGSKVGLIQQRRYAVSQLFVALLIASGNDAATALAEAAGGTRKTAALMNQTAISLQAKDTFVRNASGLDAARQRSSAYDLALIGRAGLALPAFRTYTMTRKAYLPAKRKGKRFEIYTHNQLLRRDYPGALGGKSGFTAAARHTFVGFAQRGNRRLVVTVMKADKGYYPDVKALLDWGFKAAGKVDPVGELVPPLDELVVPGAASAGAGGGGVQAAPAGGGALLGIGLHLRWWYAGAPVVLLLLLLVSARRRRRRRRRGYYGPQTRLRLPVR